MNESYLMVVTCCLINLKVLSFDGYGKSIQASLTLFFAIFLVLFAPYYFFRSVHKRTYDGLMRSTVRQKWGQLYAGLNLKKVGTKALLWPEFFLARRFVLAIVVVVVQDQNYFVFEMMVLIYIEMIALCILYYVKPFKDPDEVWTETWNEVMILVLGYLMITFSPIHSDLEVKFMMGYIVVLIIGSHLIVNLFGILHTNYLLLKKRYVIYKSRKIYTNLKKKYKERNIEPAKMAARLKSAITDAVVTKKQQTFLNNLAVIHEERTNSLEKEISISSETSSFSSEDLSSQEPL
jgi:hypothetical protein